MSDVAILEDVNRLPRGGKAWVYRWCDYVEMRCLIHPDRRFSRDNLVEGFGEAADIDTTEYLDIGNDEGDEVFQPLSTDDTNAATTDRHEAFSARCFRQLHWRSKAFGADWPFVIDPADGEVKVRSGDRTARHWLYLQLLLCASLSYCPSKRRANLTGPFEALSLHVFRHLMPVGSEVHEFGTGRAKRYTGHLYDRLVALARDLRGVFKLQREHFARNDVGDGGLDLVAWHGLGDHRDGIIAALAQCGCTADGWPLKMQSASPDRLSGQLSVGTSWATYYFMPLDLADEINGNMDWQQKSDMATAIVIDRLRFLRLADADALLTQGILQPALVREAEALQIT